MTATRRGRRVACGVALVVLALGAVGCGGDSGGSDGGGTSGSGSSDAASSDAGSPAGSTAENTPEEAYTAFVEAIRAEDASALDAAVTEGYWSDLMGDQQESTASLATLHWAVENDVLTLPDDPGVVALGADVMGQYAEPGDVERYADLIAEEIGVDGLTGDDLALVTVPDAVDQGLVERVEEKGCVEKDQSIQQCLANAGSTEDRLDYLLTIVRVGDAWRVFHASPFVGS